MNHLPTTSMRVHWLQCAGVTRKGRRCQKLERFVGNDIPKWWCMYHDDQDDRMWKEKA